MAGAYSTRTTSVPPRDSLLLWVAPAAIGAIYVAGEEASWGQHFFGWTTPEERGQVNDQNETDPHSVSSWLEPKRPGLLKIGAILGAIILALAALCWPAIRRHRLGILMPPLIGLPCALLAEIFRPMESAYDVVSGQALLVERPSEEQEMCYLPLSCSISSCFAAACPPKSRKQRVPADSPGGRSPIGPAAAQRRARGGGGLSPGESSATSSPQALTSAAWRRRSISILAAAVAA